MAVEKFNLFENEAKQQVLDSPEPLFVQRSTIILNNILYYIDRKNIEYEPHNILQYTLIGKYIFNTYNSIYLSITYM